jgi:hypothetical protein
MRRLGPVRMCVFVDLTLINTLLFKLLHFLTYFIAIVFLFSGSAMVGGYIIDRYGIVVNFSITVLVQMFLGTLPLLLIWKYVPDEKDTSSMAALWQDTKNKILKFYQTVACQCNMLMCCC